jgi:hypothetical protein
MERPRFPVLPYVIALALLFLFAMAPIFVTVYAANAAQADGCTVSNGLLAACTNGGEARAAELQGLANSFWWALFTWPAGIVGASVWLLVLWMHRSKWKRRVGLDG